MKYPEKFNDLIEALQQLPSIGNKSAERMAYFLLNMSKEKIDEFTKAISEAKENINNCKICGCMCDENICQVCDDQTRDTSIICVVQTSKDAYALERTKDYKGTFHVLNGVISAVNGVSPSDINIASLLERVGQNNVKEVILATNPNVEGENTALYIAKLLGKYQVNVTRLAYGLPVGGNLDYADEFTLLKAMQGRRKI